MPLRFESCSRNIASALSRLSACSTSQLKSERISRPSCEMALTSMLKLPLTLTSSLTGISLRGDAASTCFSKSALTLRYRGIPSRSLSASRVMMDRPSQTSPLKPFTSPPRE